MEEKKKHPLHLAVADEIQDHLDSHPDSQVELKRDPACGGQQPKQHLPLFIGKDKANDTRMCCVDLLVISNQRIRVIIEIEESGFLPTKIFGKVFQAAIADNFIHNRNSPKIIPYAQDEKGVLFVQVLDGSKILKPGGKKEKQARRIEERICSMLPQQRVKTSERVVRIKDYKIFFVKSPDDKSGLRRVSHEVSSFIIQSNAACSC
jgi:hypothetical protein